MHGHCSTSQEPASGTRTIITLYERALELDPSSIAALTGLARALIAWGTMLGEDPTPAALDRISALISQAAAIDGDHSYVLLASGHLLRLQRRWTESIPIFQRLIELHPGEAEGYARLAFSKMRAGAADEAIPVLEMSLRLDPRNPLAYNSYSNLAYAMLLVGRYQECIEWNQRALLANPTGAWLDALVVLESDGECPCLERTVGRSAPGACGSTSSRTSR